jgi:hypothetical protein
MEETTPDFIIVFIPEQKVATFRQPGGTYFTRTRPDGAISVEPFTHRGLLWLREQIVPGGTVTADTLHDRAREAGLLVEVWE